MSHVVIYHAHCSDGTTAAAIALDALGKCQLIDATYGEECPIEELHGKDVLIVDFSYPRETLERIHAVAKSLLVLDHHKTAAEALAGLPYAHFDMERSGAGMTWDHLYPGEPRPYLVTHVEDRDLWRFANGNTKAFCAAFQFDQAACALPEDKVAQAQLMLHMDEADYLKMVSEGSMLVESEARIVENICQQAYPLELLGTEFMCVNAPGVYASEGGNYLVRTYGKPAAVWYTDGHEVKVSLRSRDDLTDVSDIARAFGGGGHRNAAGFRAGLMFYREIGVAVVPPEVEPGHELEAAGQPGVAVWDVNQPAPIPGA